MAYGWQGGPQQAAGRGMGVMDSGGDGPLYVLVGAVALVFSLSWVVWLAAAVTELLAGHGFPGGTVANALPFTWHLVTGEPPAAAWHAASAQAPAFGPVWLFWLLLVLLLGGLLAALVWGLVKYRAGHRPYRGAQWATRREEARMVVPADPVKRNGRLTAGHSEVTGRLLAAERCMSATAFGPNGSGKTVSLVVPNALEWDGPAVISTAKGPDIHYMKAARAKYGPVYIVAPTGLPGQSTASWSPVDYAKDEESATRMGQWLCDAAAMGDDTRAKPWITQARQFIAPLLLAANHSGKGIDAFISFVERFEEAAEEVRELLRAANAFDALRQYNSVWKLHPDGRGSVMFTANTLIDAYLNPKVRASAQSSTFTVEDVINKKGTVFVVAPPSESDALAPLFTAMVASLLYAAERKYEQMNINLRPGTAPRPLDPPLLLDLDEAGNVFRYRDLPRLSSTGRGMGIQLLTIWHDISQLISRYGEQGARTIINQSKLRMVLPGGADEVTLQFFSDALGPQLVDRESHTHGSEGRDSTTTNVHEVPLMYPWQIQRLEVGHAVIQYDNLPPMRVRMRNAEADKALLALAQPSRTN